MFRLPRPTARQRLHPSPCQNPGGPGFGLRRSGKIRSDVSDSRPFVIRQLAPGTLALLGEMLTVIGEAFHEVKTYGDRRPSADYLKRLLRGDSFIALAALKDERIVGGLAAYEFRQFEQEHSETKICDVTVAVGHRRTGQLRPRNDIPPP